MDKFSQHFADFHVAGFSYWSGIDVIDRLKVGTSLELQLDEDNAYDPRAVELLFDGKRIGYVPGTENLEIHRALYFGHDIFEAIITQINLEVHPERQLRVMVRIKDAREKDSRI